MRDIQILLPVPKRLPVTLKTDAFRCHFENPTFCVTFKWSSEFL